MTRPKTWDTKWMGILWDGNLKPHWEWYRRGRTGDGRIVMADENLQGAAVRSLAGARFERCDFSGANFYGGSLADIELVECAFDDGAMLHSRWDRGQIVNCRFRGAWLGLSNFIETIVDGGDWLGCYLERSDWQRARVTDVSFRMATLVDTIFDDATFTDCDFRNASLFRKEHRTGMATCGGTRFVRCDFQGASLDGLRLDRTVFERCKFFDTVGKPALEGPCELIEPDFTIGIDEDIRTEAEVLAMWRDGSAAEIGAWSRQRRPRT